MNVSEICRDHPIFTRGEHLLCAHISSLVVVALLLQVFYLADCESGGSSAFKAPWAPMALSLNSISARNLSSIRKEC
jgi:hypothetical protein